MKGHHKTYEFKYRPRTKAVTLISPCITWARSFLWDSNSNLIRK